mgnify:CR=1 FL=1
MFYVIAILCMFLYIFFLDCPLPNEPRTKTSKIKMFLSITFLILFFVSIIIQSTIDFIIY